jgi:sugar lactone lactonase YvrE
MAGFAMVAGSACVDDACESVAGQACAVAGTSELGFNRDGLAPQQTDLFLPSAARRGPDDRLYIMDFNNQRLRQVDDEGVVQTVVGNGFHAIATTEIAADTTALENPIDFTWDAAGDLVFVSYHDPRVLRLGDDGMLHALAGAADGVVGVDGDEGDGGPAIDALFIQLDSIVIAPDDTIYVSDSLANRVRRIRDGVITTVAGTGQAAYDGDGGPGVDAAVHWPSALALDAAGNLLIAETRSHVVRRLAPDGTIDTLAGTGVPGAAGDGGPAAAAQFNQPYGLAVDSDGTIYVADRGNFRVRAIAPDGTIDTLAGTGFEGMDGDGGPARRAEFGYVARLSLDGDSLLVADQSNSLIRRVILR